MSRFSRNQLSSYLWTGLAVVVCPCHLPLIIGALAGTTAGALLSRHWIVGLAALITLFLLAAMQAWRGLCASSCGNSCALAREPGRQTAPSPTRPAR